MVNFLQNGGHPPSLTHLTHTGTTLSN